MATKVQKIYQNIEEERAKWEALIAARNAQESYASYFRPGSIRPARIVANEDENIVTVEFEFDDAKAELDFFFEHQDKLPSPPPVVQAQQYEEEEDDDLDLFHDTSAAIVQPREGITPAEVVNQYNALAKEGETYKPQFKAPETRTDNSVLLQFPDEAARNQFLESLAAGNNKTFIAYDDNNEPLAVANGDGTVIFKSGVNDPTFDAALGRFHDESGLAGALDDYEGVRGRRDSFDGEGPTVNEGQDDSYRF